ncbi:hypothetical protein P8452_61468 [Trifolium repens]|nr:hypothetical protein P8452_61468 [Trifolium repens]
MKCQDNTIARVLVDTGSSLNVMPKSTLVKLSLDGPVLKPSSMIVKAFDGSQREVIGEIELPMVIGPHLFNISFQVMDINPSYSCLLGRPWIHAAGAVTSTLHQKLKFIVDDKLVIVSGEEDALVSHLSSFRYIETEEGVLETQFQALEIATVTLADKGEKDVLATQFQALKITTAAQTSQKPRASITSWKSLKKDMEEGVLKGDQINMLEDEEASQGSHDWVRQCPTSFVLSNWKAVEIPQVFFISKNEPLDHNNAVNLHDLGLPINLTEEDEEEDCELPAELARLLDQEQRMIQPHQEPVDVINLGTEEDKKEVKIGAALQSEVKESLVKLLQEYVDVFAWSYQDMSGLDTSIVEHKLPLKPECAPVKQKLRRTRPDMALKIQEEVKKQFDAGFLAVAKYPEWVANIVPVPKKDGKVRMCVDYRDLNRASPKDDFPLPHIDVLVDNTARFPVFSFMDGFSGYNQIKMAPEDMEKTTFITP